MTELTFTWSVPKEWSGLLLREFLLDEKKVSRRLLTDIKFQGGRLLVNEEPVTVRKILQAGDRVTIVFPQEKENEFMQPTPMKLAICYEDEHILIIDKPPFLATIPSREEPYFSLAQGILAYYQKHQIASAIHIVTRLDKNTSGLVLVAKHRYAHSLLALQQKKKEIERTYLAVVDGWLEKDRGIINRPIGRKESSIIEREVRADGQVAITHFNVLQRLADKTVVQVSLETGRTHQIRVHFASIGFPLAGDSLYGTCSTDISRQALHSKSLEFVHPFTKEKLLFQSTMPDDMQSLIK